MDSVEKHKKLCDEINILYAKKNHDYSDSYHDSYVEYNNPMIAIRLDDKLKRFKTLIKQGAMVNDESIRDTLIDLANYALMGVMEVDNNNCNEIEGWE